MRLHKEKLMYHPKSELNGRFFSCNSLRCLFEEFFKTALLFRVYCLTPQTHVPNGHAQIQLAMSVILVLQAKYHRSYSLLFDREFLAGFVNSLFPDVWWKETGDPPNIFGILQVASPA